MFSICLMRKTAAAKKRNHRAQGVLRNSKRANTTYELWVSIIYSTPKNFHRYIPSIAQMIGALLIAVSLAAFASVTDAECANACNGHGKCTAYDMCLCNRNWQASDCSERVCMFGLAHVDTPKVQPLCIWSHNPPLIFKLLTIFSVTFTG